MAAYELGFKEEEIRGKFNLKSWGSIFKASRKWWWLFLIVLFGMIVTSFYDVTFVTAMNRGLIQAFENQGISDIATFRMSISLFFDALIFELSFLEYCIILIVSMIGRCALIFALFFSANYLCLVIMNNLRQECFQKIQALSFSYFDRTPSGWLIARLENDTSKIAEVISWGVIRVFWPIFDWVFALITMFSISWIYSLYLLIPIPIIFGIALYYNAQVMKRHRLSRTTYSNFIRWLADCLAGMRTIKVLSIEKSTLDDAEHISETYRQRGMRVTMMHTIFGPILTFAGALTLVLLIFIFTVAGGENPGGMYFLAIADLAVFIGLAGKIVEPIVNISDSLLEFMDAQTSIEKIVGLLNEKIEIQDSEAVCLKYGSIFSPNKEAYEPMGGEIEFRNVNYHYVENTPVLHDVSFQIKKGTTTAIVGETGSGKTTIANIMCRFYEPRSGEVLIDQVEYRTRSVGWLRSNIGYVEQNPLIFTLSLRDNIRYGKLDATDDEIMKAMDLVGLTDILKHLPYGLDSILIDKGSELSMGERQLISFARAVIRDPKIVILDEATANIDTETEIIIQKSLRSLLKNRSSLIIAHRLSTITHADQIIVLKDGVIQEVGNHKELLKKEGYYHRLYMNQFSESRIDQQLEMAEDLV